MLKADEQAIKFMKRVRVVSDTLLEASVNDWKLSATRAIPTTSRLSSIINIANGELCADLLNKSRYSELLSGA